MSLLSSSLARSVLHPFGRRLPGAPVAIMATRIHPMKPSTPAASGDHDLRLALAAAMGTSLLVRSCATGCEEAPPSRRPDPHPINWGPPPPGGFCLPFSAAVDTGSLVYISGQTPNTSTAGQDVAAQTREVLIKLDKALESVGMDKKQIITVEAVLWDIADLPVVAEIYHKWIADDEVLPTISLKEVEGLCGNVKVEIAIRASRLQKIACLKDDADSVLHSSTCIRAGDFTFVSGVVDPTGKDTTTQLQGVLHKVDVALIAAGMERGDIVVVQVDLTDLAELGTVSHLYSTWLGSMNVLPMTLCAQGRSLQHGATVQISVIASHAPRLRSSCSDRMLPTKFSSSVTRVGDFAYASAIAPLAPDTASQVHGVCGEIDVALASVGMHKGDIVEARATLKDIGDLMLMNRIYADWLHGVEVLPAKMVHASTLCANARFELAVVACTAARKGTKTLSMEKVTGTRVT